MIRHEVQQLCICAHIQLFRTVGPLAKQWKWYHFFQLLNVATALCSVNVYIFRVL